MTALARKILIVATVIAAPLFAGCAAPQLILPNKAFAPPTTIVLEGIPELRTAAFIGIPSLPAFTPHGDVFFSIPQEAVSTPDHQRAVTDALIQQLAVGPPVSVGGGIAAAGVAGIFGAILQAKAEDTQKKAMRFHEDVKQRLPGVDLGADFMTEVRRSLEAQGIRVELSPAPYPVRARWPVPDESGTAFEPQAGNPPAVDADLYVQITPRAVLTAPGPMNAYYPIAAAVVLIFDGRTKELLQKKYFGAQDFWASQAYNYSSLVEEPQQPVAEVRRVLMGLVPFVVEAISTKPAAPGRGPASVSSAAVPRRAQ